MDEKFRSAVAAIHTHDSDRLRALLRDDPSLATARSFTSHPTLLQCLVLSAKDAPNKLDMARILIDAGAELNGPLIACGSCDNVQVAELLLARGAAIDVDGGWSSIEEALYWHNFGVVDLLLRRGASVRNLRIAAGLGRTDQIQQFFNDDGTLKPEAGSVNWPWGDIEVIQKSNFDRAGKEKLSSRVQSWDQSQQGVVNNAFVYACMHGHIDAAQLLLNKGAEINVIPGGFDFAGTGLHYAALHGHLRMVEFLVGHGADRHIKDEKVGSTPADWAEHGGHLDVRDYLS
jgi:ankyrin repeat protein